MAGNFEINLEIFNANTAAAMEKIFKLDLENSHELTHEAWEKRGFSARLGERLLKPFGVLL